MSIQVIEKARPPEPETLAGCPEGEVLPLVFWPDDRLKRISQEVPAQFFGHQLDKLVSDLATTMYMTGGMGLSAIQVGIPYRVFVCDITAQSKIGKQPNQLLTIVNPTISVPPAAARAAKQEGCLSFPGVHELVERPDAVVIAARDRAAEMRTLVAGATLARVILHEMDHLDGKTFLDRMKPMAKRSAEKAINAFHHGVRSDTIRVGGPKSRNPTAVAKKRGKRRRRVTGRGV